MSEKIKVRLAAFYINSVEKEMQYDINNNTNAVNNTADPDLEKPYMGNMTSKEIGKMAYAGHLGGQMVRRMIKEQEEKLAEQYKSRV